MLKFTISLLAMLVVLAACSDYEEMEFVPSENGIEVSGVIDDRTLANLETVVKGNPSLKQLVLRKVPGSADDEASLTNLSRFIHSNGLTTIVPSNGVVASGGTDMALMGVTRIIESGACIGVHTWGAGGLFSQETGADIPKDDAAHELYLSFYREVGIPEEFYWFTLNAAGPDEMHWMSAEEINRYGLSSVLVKAIPNETAEQRAQRCFARF